MKHAKMDLKNENNSPITVASWVLALSQSDQDR